MKQPDQLQADIRVIVEGPHDPFQVEGVGPVVREIGMAETDHGIDQGRIRTAGEPALNEQFIAVD